MRLGDIANVAAGNVAPPKSEFSREGTPFVRAGSLSQLREGGNLQELEKISEDTAKRLGLKLFPAGTVLFAKSGMSCTKGNVYCLPEPCYVVSHLACITPKKPISKYLKHYFCYCKPNALIDNPSFPSIRLSRISQTKIYLPSDKELEEQISALDAAEAMISQSKMFLSHLQTLVKSRFIEMFGDTYLNTKSFKSCKLGELIGFMTSGSRGWAQHYSNDGEFFITIKNVKNCSLDISDVQHVQAPNNKEAARTRVKEGDVLVSITADLGRTGVVTKEIADHGAYINQHLACIRLATDLITPIFLSYYLESPGGVDQFAKKNQNGVKAGLNFDLVKTLNVLLPPLPLQQEFAAFAQQAAKLEFVAQKQIEKLQLLYDSLAQEYFG